MRTLLVDAVESPEDEANGSFILFDVAIQELELLKEFEKKDHMLNSKSAAKKAEQEELGVSRKNQAR